MDSIRRALEDRILILDGAMGTMLQHKGFQGNNESFNLSNPELIFGIHEEYIKAGAEIITTNSFGANRISQDSLGLADRSADMAEAAARIARKAADNAAHMVWVAGSLGPTGKSLTLPSKIGDPVYRPVSFDEMAAAYEEQIKALLAGGADILLFETCFDALNTKAALYALDRVMRNGSVKPEVMVSVSTTDLSGRTLTGQTVEAFYRSVRHSNPLSFGLNCSLGSKEMVPLIAETAVFTDCAVSCHPNAGLPDALGDYTETPETMAAAIMEMAAGGYVNIVGGCCGTTPEHISAIAAAVKGKTPRVLPESTDGALFVSGLESVRIDRNSNFTNIGERTNVAGSRKFARLISEGDYETALQVAADQIENGANIIDINMDDAMLDSGLEMERFLRHISGDSSVAKAAVMIDSSHWDTLVTGLKNAQGRCIVNSVSLKEGEEMFLYRAREIKSLGAALIVIAFDEEGQATSFRRKVEICRRAYDLLTGKAGFSPNDIIFDVNVLPVGTGIPEHRRYAVDFIEAVRWIKGNLPGCRTSGGISNLSFSFRGNNAVREAMHTVFLYHAISAGLDMGIVNPGMLKVYDEIDPELRGLVEDVILDSDPGATERLTAYAQTPAAKTRSPEQSGPGEPSPAIRTSVEDRIKDALLKGNIPDLESSVNECLGTYGDPFKVIDGPLMDGMSKVGELFGSGKMFLPQVVKSARAMKSAVDVLKPYMEKSPAGSVDRPKVVLATVKGDVHDIGKNITGIVFNCNGFDVKDLGVMVPKETILETAVSEKADIIGVSGLITPSLYQMELLCKEMKARGMDTPLLVGGAAASAIHTAVKLSPLYDHVFYGSDASASAVLASRLVSDREETEKSEHLRQAGLRELYDRSRSAPDKNGSGDRFPEDSYIHGQPFDSIPARRIPMEKVERYFNWNLFATILGIKKGRGRMEFRKLMAAASRIIDRMKADGNCKIMVAARFDEAHSEKDDIVSQAFRLPMFRQKGARSLADFVAPEEYGFDSPMGMFAISVEDAGPAGLRGKTEMPEDEAIVRRAVTLTLAEAASSYLDGYIRDMLPKDSNARIIKPAAGYSSCPDHTLKKDILRLLPDSDKLGITLLGSYAMIPEATICGLIFIHDKASYPEIRHPSESEVLDYASRRGMNEYERTRFLGHLI